MFSQGVVDVDVAPPRSDIGTTPAPAPDHAIVDRPLFKESSEKRSVIDGSLFMEISKKSSPCYEDYLENTSLQLFKLFSSFNDNHHHNNHNCDDHHHHIII